MAALHTIIVTNNCTYGLYTACTCTHMICHQDKWTPSELLLHIECYCTGLDSTAELMIHKYIAYYPGIIELIAHNNNYHCHGDIINDLNIFFCFL